MNKMPKVYIEKNLSDLKEKNIIFLVNNVIKRMNLKKTNALEEAEIIISNENTDNNEKVLLFIENDKISIYNKDELISELKSKYNLTILENALFIALSIFLNKNITDLFVLKSKQTLKISRFLQALVVTMEVEDSDTKMSHSQRVAYYAVLFAKYLKRNDIDVISELAMLHDIGRIGIEQLMLFTPTRINEFESWDLEHSVTGSIFLSSLDELWYAVPVIRSHHENWDGTGYPDSLSGEQIPFYARFIGIIDWFDLATHTASSEFDGIMDPNEAVDFVKSNSGVIFDPILADQFYDFMSDYLKNNKFI